MWRLAIDDFPAAGLLADLARQVEPLESELYDEICDRVGATNDGQRAGAIELALEGLYLARKISKESGGGETVYG